MDDQKTIVVSVHAKDCVDYQCRRCGQCCRHIKDSLMVESLDAYRLANYLRGRDPNICTIDDVLTQYCEPMPLTQECFPIFMLKTTGTDDSCIFLKDGLCSIYEARPRTCRIYPFSVGPGERGRDFEYCLCFDRNQQYHFTGGKVSVKDWFYRNFPRMEKEYDLYYGDYEPSVFKTQSEHQKQLNHNASMAEELLRQKMGNSPEAMAAFEAYQLAAGECSSIVAEQAFESGYQTAVQMLVAGLIPPENKFASEAPLTVQELRKMDGEQVFCLDMNEEVRVVARKKGFIQVTNDKEIHRITGLTLYRHRPSWCQ